MNVASDLIGVAWCTYLHSEEGDSKGNDGFAIYFTEHESECVASVVPALEAVVMEDGSLGFHFSFITALLSS